MYGHVTTLLLLISVVGIISVVIGGHFGGGDHFDGGDHFGGGTGSSRARMALCYKSEASLNIDYPWVKTQLLK